MKDLRMISVRSRLALVLLLIAIVTPVRAESASERIARLQAELEWVEGELRTIDLYGDSERREGLESEVERLEQERLKLLRVMPEHVDADELLEQLTRLAGAEELDLHADELETIDHGDYQTVTIRLKLEGSGDARKRFVRRLRLSQGAKRVTEVEEDGTVGIVDVTAFMIPPKTVELRSCSIPDSSPDASERESMLRERLISLCAILDETDPKLRTAIHRRRQLMESINLITRLYLEETGPRELIDRTPVETEVEFTGEMPPGVAEILAEPEFLDGSESRESGDNAPIEAEVDSSEEMPADLAGILEEPRPPLEERMKRADAMADMRWIAVAAEAYEVDHRRYPETSDMAQLADTLADYVADAVGTLARTDPWGEPYRWISDGRNYRIVGGGRDGVIEETSLVLSSEPQQSDDIVYQNGSFRQ